MTQLEFKAKQDGKSNASLNMDYFRKQFALFEKSFVLMSRKLEAEQKIIYENQASLSEKQNEDIGVHIQKIENQISKKRKNKK